MHADAPLRRLPVTGPPGIAITARTAAGMAVSLKIARTLSPRRGGAGVRPARRGVHVVHPW